VNFYDDIRHALHKVHFTDTLLNYIVETWWNIPSNGVTEM